ncbi:Metallo-dependent phosphatase-like protein [Lactarius hengduanensis]|nr:Metallo-dependent phosphatase-like protein [Lactarius hengduanensis]
MTRNFNTRKDTAHKDTAHYAVRLVDKRHTNSYICHTDLRLTFSARCFLLLCTRTRTGYTAKKFHSNTRVGLCNVANLELHSKVISMTSLPGLVTRLFKGPGSNASTSGWTRFVCVSDTHSKTFAVPAGDVLIHAGDLSSWGSVKQLKVTVDWLLSLPHPVKMWLCLDEGSVNSGKLLYSSVSKEDVVKARSMLQSRAARAAGLYYLEHESMELKTGDKVWKIYGSPAAPRFMPGSFQYETDIPEILLTHTPAYGVLDVARRGAHAGCKTLSATLGELKQCKLHVFGHIHEAHGGLIHPDGGRVSVNAAMADGYGQAVIVDLKIT